MISIDKIRVEDSLEKICENRYDVFFHGTDLDERTETVIQNIKVHPRYKVYFSKSEYEILIDNKSYGLMNLKNFFRENNYHNILIDSTSLDFPELLYLLNALRSSNSEYKIKIIYVEPQEYANVIDDDQEEDFKLSDKMHPFSALPLFAVNMQTHSEEDTVLTSFLGFENSRLGQVLVNDDSATFKKLTACISVPAYNSGWENTSLKKHLKYFNQIESELKLYPGSNPYAVNELLEELLEHHQRLIITSLGTKPTAIGISVFLINNASENNESKYVGAVYDFPVKTKGRSKGVGLIHTYTLSI